MKKTPETYKTGRKASGAARAIDKAIVADLTEFADALESGIDLATKYTIRHVELPDPPATDNAIRSRHAKQGRG